MKFIRRLWRAAELRRGTLCWIPSERSSPRQWSGAGFGCVEELPRAGAWQQKPRGTRPELPQSRSILEIFLPPPHPRCFSLRVASKGLNLQRVRENGPFETRKSGRAPERTRQRQLLNAEGAEAEAQRTRRRGVA